MLATPIGRAVLFSGPRELANPAIQTIPVGVGTANNGGFDIVASGNLCGINQTLTPVEDGRVYRILGEWSGNDEGRTILVFVGGTQVSMGAAASGVINNRIIAGTSNELVRILVSGSLNTETFYLKLASIKKVG